MTEIICFVWQIERVADNLQLKLPVRNDLFYSFLYTLYYVLEGAKVRVSAWRSKYKWLAIGDDSQKGVCL